MELAGKQILVTGATGFVGTALIQRLLREKALLSAAVLSPEGTGHLPAEVGRVIVPPLSGSSDYSTPLQHVDIVVHLAARVHIMRDAAMDPLREFRRVNLHGTECLARQAARAGVRRFVFISTVKVHGEESALPYREDSPIAPADPYGTSKAEAEEALWRVAAETGLEVAIVRPPLVYGPGVKANFRELMKLVSLGIPLPFASICNRRSFLFVGNLADAIACCAAHHGSAGETYLVSDGEDLSTPELIKSVAKAMGKPARLFPFPPGLLRLAGRISGSSSAVERLVGSLRVDSSKIRRELGWAPPFTMEHGLGKTAEWFRGGLP
jgi:nucleoside-diphosphate-sugar epimerase